ncbi:MAG: LysM peptidoglycan-binding domain-containing M23 family metallopeptidase [Proteobacteria bacterium]|nr:LysM peptidoglycan-binding domain-containing M23 family metallopeptidase [Pseudomonadota bacterium]
MKIPLAAERYRNRWTLLIPLLIILLTGLSACSRSYRTPSSGIWHSVQTNETLEKIGARYSVSSLDIQRANDIYDSRDLDAGMRIFIPGAKELEKSRTRRTGTKSFSGKLAWPSAGTVSSGYGKRHGRMHRGLDITRDGGRDILAAGSGIVEFAGYQNGFGKTIIINHGRGIKTLYAHNAKLYVKKRMKVRQGAVIAKMGSTGKSTGIHLHFEVRVNGKAQNPLRFLPVR